MSKLGVQSQSGIIQDLDLLLSRKPAVYKLLGNGLNIGIAREIRAQSPKTFLVIRTGSNWAVDDDGFIQRYADEATRLGMPFLQEGLCDLLEPPNEPVVQTVELAKLLNDRQVQYAQTMKARGFVVGAYNFSVGNPDYPLWPFLQDGIRASDFWLLLHEYGAPLMDSDPANLALRHRKVLTLLAPDVRAKVKIGIGETGIDLGAVGRAGGFRKAFPPTDQQESIDPFIKQLAWYDGELQKDPAVKWAAIFGYAMQEPWNEELGFDVASIDTERRKFIAAMQPGDFDQPPANPPPPGDGMSTPYERMQQSWKLLGNIVPNTDAAFYKFAVARGGGRPLSNESRYRDANGKEMANQAWEHFYTECANGDWGNIMAYRYEDGQEYVPPTVVIPPVPMPAPNPGGMLPYKFPNVLTAIGAMGQESSPIAGQPFYRLSGAAVRQGVSAFMVVTVIGKNGVPVVGAKVLNQFPVPASGDAGTYGNGEIIQTDGSGTARFQFGASSAFTNPGSGPFTVFVADDSAFKDNDSVPKRVVFKARLSDVVKSLGDFQGQHTEINIQYVEQAIA